MPPVPSRGASPRNAARSAAASPADHRRAVPAPRATRAPDRPTGPRLSAAAFARAMAGLGPFEPDPHIAVAVSGGADSMALALLASRWAQERGGRVTALTVDHRLRPGSAGEARLVGRRLDSRGIDHRILTWREGAAAGRANRQARAREARYGLMEAWCRRSGVLHLLTAHHLDDQAETFLLRLARGSGARGLAAMAAVRERANLRILRPLLRHRRAPLEAYLLAEGEEWIDDPSNADPVFARARLRVLMPALAARGLSADRIAGTATRLGAQRRGLEAMAARLLAMAAFPHPAGFIVLDRESFLGAPDEVRRPALARALGAVGGAPYAPRYERLARLDAAIARARFAPRTLGGCRIEPMGRGRILVLREAAAQDRPLALTGPGTVDWDGRFRLAIGGEGPGGAVLGPLGRDGWAELRRAAPDAVDGPRARGIPSPARPTLPALRDGHGVLEVPHIGYRRSDAGAGTLGIREIRPFPPESLAGPRFGRD